MTIAHTAALYTPQRRSTATLSTLRPDRVQTKDIIISRSKHLAYLSRLTWRPKHRIHITIPTPTATNTGQFTHPPHSSPAHGLVQL